MIAVFLEGKAVIEAPFFLGERQAWNHRRHRRWSFYTALPLSSSFFVPEQEFRVKPQRCYAAGLASSGESARAHGAGSRTSWFCFC